MTKLTITVGAIALDIETLDTPTAQAIIDALPFTSRASTWGDEVYFSTPVSPQRESDARDLMELGEIAFWTDGDAIAIGYGETPISAPGEIRLASPANIWAHALGDVKTLATAKAGDAIEVRLAD